MAFYFAYLLGRSPESLLLETMLKGLVRACPSESKYLLHWRQKIVDAVIYSRPAVAVRSPYLADVRLQPHDSPESDLKLEVDQEELNSWGIATCHAPSLGCGGLVDEGRQVHVSPLAEKCKSSAKAPRHSSHRIVMATDTTPRHCLVGVDPLLPNSIGAELLNRFGWNLGKDRKSRAKDISQESHTAEVSVGDCRFDFITTLQGSKEKQAFITEIKSVPLTNVSITHKYSAASKQPVGLFPWVPKYDSLRLQSKRRQLSRAQAQRQMKASARVCKHLLQLAALCPPPSDRSGPNLSRSCVQVNSSSHTVAGCQMLFVATRPDVSSIVLTTRNNPALTDCVAAAVTAGVRLVGCSTNWDKQGIALHRWVPVLTDGPSIHSRFHAALQFEEFEATGNAGDTKNAAPHTMEGWRLSETHKYAEAARLQKLGGSIASLGNSAYPAATATATGHHRTGPAVELADLVALDGEEVMHRMKEEHVFSPAACALFQQDAFGQLQQPGYFSSNQR